MKELRHPITAFALLAFAWLILGTGCATNPVTGKKELAFVSEAQEIQLGTQNYIPMQQAQGGDQNAFPKVTEYVDNVGQRLAEVSDRPHLPYDFVVLNNGVPNAWALPGGKIAVNRGLLTELGDEAELAAVLGHEIVHAAARHGAQSMQRGIIMQAGLIGLGLAVENHDYRDIIIGAGGLTASLVGLKYGRNAELEADRYGIKYMAKAGYDPHAAVDLQETFLRLANGRNPGWLEGLFASHPPSQERVDKNRELVAGMPEGGVRNKEAYDNVLQGLREALPAYDKLEEGHKALQKGNASAALRLANEAIRIEPRESLFYLLAAKAQASQKQYNGALKDLDKAIARNDRYFDHYLQRGLIRKLLGQANAAKQDLTVSARLLPTAQANTALGFMALESGSRDSAINHFALAASADSDAGRQSLTMLTRLDLPVHPERYIQVSAQRDQRGYLIISATNRSQLPVQNLVISVDLYNERGRLVSRNPVRFDGILPSGRTARANSRIGPFASVNQLANSVRMRITSAEVRQ